MARYIDADALLSKNSPVCILHNKTASVKRVLMQAPTADVVPRSEDEIRGGSFCFELAKVEERGKQLMREHDSKIAREIFEEVEKSVHSKIPKQIHPIFKNDRDFGDGFRDGKTDALIEVLVLISELKKKYTEGK